MSSPRRDFLKELLAAGALPGFMASPLIGRPTSALLEQDAAQDINPDLDAKAYSFWSNFLSTDADPIVGANGQRRGGSSPPPDDVQPVFLHYGPEGFKNAAELDISKLVPEGDVMVSVNTSTVKVADQDEKIFQRVQNAQIRVDVAQKTGIIPIVEAMAYTLVAGMLSPKAKSPSKSNSKTTTNTQSKVQNVSVSSDSAWQKMQSIPLPSGGSMGIESRSAKKGFLIL